ncbi:MAG: fused MFS/spermidine synthase [Proteobacteria bacterium]|nr:fused MFS/spermidine synthase [Pseudomonadota bacterium]
MRTLVLTCAFIAGFCIMTIELLGGKILAPYFGSSVYVWGSIITIFMLALSGGYLAGGKLSTLNPGTRTYGLLLIAAAITVLPLIFGHEWVSDQIFSVIEDPRYGSLLASIILFFIPTFILGMISPYSIRLLIDSTASSGQTAGFLYFVSTLGSAIGTLATSFYLVLWFEIDTVLYAVSLVLGLAGIWSLLSKRLEVA